MEYKSKEDLIYKVGLPYHWNEEEVWEINQKVEEMNISDLEWHLDYPFWDAPNGTGYAVAPMQVIYNPKEYQEHWNKINKADTKYPLDIFLHPDSGKWVLLDGLHRLVRLILDDNRIIKVRKISIIQLSSLPSFKFES